MALSDTLEQSVVNSSPSGDSRGGLTFIQKRLVGSQKMERSEFRFRRALRALWGAIVILAVVTAILVWHNWLVLIFLFFLLPLADVLTESWTKYERDWAAANQRGDDRNP